MQTFYTFSPENFAEKCVLKLVELFSSHCLALWPSDRDEKYPLLKLGHVKKTRFWGLKDTQQSSLILCSFSPPLFFYAFLASFFLLLGI